MRETSRGCQRSLWQHDSCPNDSTETLPIPAQTNEATAETGLVSPCAGFDTERMQKVKAQKCAAFDALADGD